MAAPAACRQMSKAGSSARPSPSAMQTRGYSTRAEAGDSVRSMSSWREQGAWGSARGGPQWQRCKRSMQTHVQQLKPYLQAAGRNDTTIINLCKRECGRCSRYLQAAGCNGTSNLCKRECGSRSRIYNWRAEMAMVQAIYANVIAAVVAASASGGPQWQCCRQYMQTCVR